MTALLPPSSGGEPSTAGSQEEATNLEDTFLLAGLLGSGELDVLRDALRASHKYQLAREQEQSAAEVKALEERIEQERAGRELDSARISSLEEERARVRAEFAAAEIKRQDLEAQSAEARNSLAARRKEYPLRMVHRRLKLYADSRESLNDLLLKDQQQRFAVEKALHELELERRTINASEYERRLRFLEMQRRRSERKFDDLDAALDRLRQLGVTRTTAGFLIWAGYLAFTVLGWLAGPVFSRAAEHGPSALHVLFLLFASALDVVLQHGPLQAILAILITPLVLLAFIFGVFFASASLLKLFDPDWDSSPKQGKGGRKPQKRERRSFWGFAQASDTRRADYTQLLAKLPVIYFWLTLPLVTSLLFTLGRRSVSSIDLSRILSDPREAFADGLFGAGICIVLAGFVMLYVLKVVEPRVQASIGAGRTSSLLLHVELVSLLGLLLAGSLVFDSLHTFWPRVPSFWSPQLPLGVLGLLLVNSFAVSYGLLYKGLFKDHTAIRKEIQRYEEEMERYAAFPALGAIEDEVERHVQRLRDLGVEIERIWREADFWEELPPAQQRTLWRSILPQRSRHRSAGDLLPIDEILEPEAVERIVSTRRELTETESWIAHLATRNEEIDRALERLRQKDWAAEIRALQQQAWQRRAEYQAESDRINRRYAELLVRCDTAFKMGTLLRTGLPEIAREEANVA